MENAATTVIEEIEVLPSAVQSELERENSLAEKTANELVVGDEVSYGIAAEYAKQAKALQKKIEEYWEPLRLSTKEAYDKVLANKKKMLDVPKNVERIIKSKMTAYLDAKERERRAREAEERRRLAEEAERKLNESIKASEAGDTESSDYAIMEAEVFENAANNVVIPKEKVSAAGVSASKAWKIVSIDPTQVPIFSNGVELRPVDEKAVMRLIKACKGKVKIPGVEFEETSNISIRV